MAEYARAAENRIKEHRPRETISEVIIMEDGTLPLGFGMALAQNETAMRKYEALTEAEKKTLMDQIHGVQSKTEMRRLVTKLADRPDANEVI